jgi:hypothetical protein
MVTPVFVVRLVTRSKAPQQSASIFVGAPGACVTPSNAMSVVIVNLNRLLKRCEQ